MTIEMWFPTIIYHSFIDDLDNVQKELEGSYNKLKKQGKFDRPEFFGEQNHSVSDPNFNENIIEKHKLKLFKKTLDWHIKDYLDQVQSHLAKPYKIDACWFTNTEKGQFALQHDHSFVDLAGVYYFKTNGNDGDIQFYNPNKLEKTVIHRKPFAAVRYKPQVGKIMLWPGWLEHRTMENKTEDTRISLSFNIFFNRF